MFFVQKIYVFFFILHKHHSEEMCWICLNVRIQKWSNCYEVELWRKFKHFLPEFLPFHENPIQCVICQYLLSTCFHTDQWESDVNKNLFYQSDSWMSNIWIVWNRIYALLLKILKIHLMDSFYSVYAWNYRLKVHL